MTSDKTPYPDVFHELKKEVQDAGLLNRVPIRGSVEMVVLVLSFVAVFSTITLWNPILLGLFMSALFSRAVFIAHDILHIQYFKSKPLSIKVSYPFANIILSNSSLWWDFKHNQKHHNWCNVPEIDEDILAGDGAFTPNNKGNNSFLRKNKYFLFWGALFFTYPSFIVQSYIFDIKNKNYGELFMMLLHWPIIWGFVFYSLPLGDAITVFVTLYLFLSWWLSFGFIPNHLGCEVFTKKEHSEMKWLELQMRTSRSLSGGVFVHWFYGGLNTQIEHHLFPKAPRFHLLKVQKITKEFCIKHNLKYFETTPLESYKQINNMLSKY